MKLPFLKISLCVLCFPILAWSVEPASTETRALVIELHGSESAPPENSVLVRDPVSQKTASIELHNLDSDPHLTQGFFSIRFFEGNQSAADLEVLDTHRNPLFAVKLNQGHETKYVVFHAAAELDKYVSAQAKAEQDALLKNLKNTQSSNLDQKQKVKAAEMQVRTQEKMQEQAQMNIEQAQVQNRMKLLEQEQELSAEAKAAKKAKAAEFAAQAKKNYAAQKYQQAATLFQKAAELDPESEDSYYNYGVSLYKIEEYNQSLAVLSVADAPEGHQLEKDYYLALNHLKLKSYETALKELREVREEQDPELSPMASYFAGTIEMQQQKFPEARKSMEFILDNSKDKKLDRSAEQALEQIDRLEAFYNSKRERYRFNLFGGMTYDGNVVNEATNSSATDNAGYRLNYGVNGTAFIRRTMESDLGIYAGISDYYSESTSFAPSPALQVADPQEVDLKVPYHSTWISGAQGQHSYIWDFTPLFRTITMSPSVGASRKEVIQSYGFSSTFAAPYSKSLFLSARLDYTADQFYLPITSPADDETDNNYGLTLIPTWLIGLKGDQSLSTEVGYWINQSNGSNYQYQKTALAASYGFPWGRFSNNARLDYANSLYPVAATSRQDDITTATLSTLRPLVKDKLNLSLSLQYVNANSSLTIYQYSKFVFTSLLTWTSSILN
jgi:hypothetical protein